MILRGCAERQRKQPGNQNTGRHHCLWYSGFASGESYANRNWPLAIGTWPQRFPATLDCQLLPTASFWLLIPTPVISRFCQELVALDDGSDPDFAVVGVGIDANDFTLAVDADALRQGNFRGQRERELDLGAFGDAGIEIETDPAGADIAGLRGLLPGRVAELHGDRQAKGETACRALFPLGLSHESASENAAQSCC